MAFALTIIKLEEAFQKKGCPLCRVKHEAAVRYIDVLLWENTNDPGIRKPINEAFGFCHDHTRMLVAVELRESGTPLGVNIIYDLLARNLAQELKSINCRGKAKRNLKVVHNTDRFARFWNNRLRGIFSNKINLAGLHPQGTCPVCVSARETETNALDALFEEIAAGKEAFWQNYTASSGLCLEHLRLGLEQCTARHPESAKNLIADTVQRLESQRGHMQEFIRKQNWAHREENLTAEESAAWLQTLAFFTGYPPERFNHKIDKF